MFDSAVKPTRLYFIRDPLVERHFPPIYNWIRVGIYHNHEGRIVNALPNKAVPYYTPEDEALMRQGMRHSHGIIADTSESDPRTTQELHLALETFHNQRRIPYGTLGKCVLWLYRRQSEEVDLAHQIHANALAMSCPGLELNPQPYERPSETINDAGWLPPHETVAKISAFVLAVRDVVVSEIGGTK